MTPRLRMRDLTLRRKIFGAFLVVTLLDVFTGLTAMASLRKVNTQAAAIRDTWLPALNVVEGLVSGVEHYRIIEGRALLTQDEGERLSSEAVLWTARDRIFVLRRDFEALRSHGNPNDHLIGYFDDAWRDYQDSSLEMVWRMFQGPAGFAAARGIYNTGGELRFKRVLNQLDAVRAFNADQVRQATESSKRIYRITVTAIFAGTACTILASWLLGMALIAGITTPVAALTRAMRRMAEDDLSTPPGSHARQDEIGIMAMALGTLHERMLQRRQLLQDEQENRRRLHNAELELLESERLAALGRMVAGVAHEINTPLGSAYTVATTLVENHREFEALARQDQLRRSDLGAFTERVGRASALIAATLQKASELVRSFKQVAVDQTSSLRRSFPLAEVARQVIATSEPLFRDRAFRLETRIDETLVMDSYPGPLGQVLGNLLDNAIIHGLDGRSDGWVRIEATALGDRALLLSVSDNGAGIAPEHRNHLFDPFFTTRFGQGGTGLGLYIVHAIVTQVLGGAIEVLSPAGGGACFQVTLPLRAPEGDAARPGAAPCPPGASP